MAKYVVSLKELVHLGALYKFNGSNGSANTAFQADIGAEFAGASVDAYYSKVYSAITATSLTAAQVAQLPALGYSVANSLAATISDNTAYALMALYKFDRLKVFAGYEYIWMNNPKNPLGVGASDQGGYFMSGVEDNNLDSEKLVNIWWTGAKYTYRSKTDFTFAWYQQRQNDFRRPPTCAPGNFRASCAGTLNEGSFYLDHHFTKRFDGFAGIAYSWVSGGLDIAIPHGPGVPYNFPDNLAPTIGGRFSF